MSVSVTFLGGLGEIGRNCAVLDVEGTLALIDCGLMFPDEDMLGVDLVLPDFSSVVERSGDVACVVLTHGHEDHVGSLSYFLRQVNVPVFGTPMAIEFARSRIEEHGIEADLHPVEYNEWVEHGGLRFALIQVSHSVPQAAGVVFETPEGLVMHSGDFKLDPTPIDGKPTDLPTFAGFGRQGVRLLLSDSTNAERPGFVPSESSLGPHLAEMVSQADGRVILACFASHVHRVQQSIDAMVAGGRKVAFLGRSMLRNSAVAVELDLLRIPDGLIVEMDELLKLPAHQQGVISTGSQGEPFAALSLMAAGEHRHIDLDSEDTVIISATPIPGNEKRVSRVINNLIRLGVKVFHSGNATVHVSGHAAQDELRTFLNVVRPDAFVPVHGEYRHLAAHASIAKQMGVPEIEVCQDGDRVVLSKGKLRRERNAVPAGYVYLDGFGLGDVDGVLRDRRHLADDGIVIITLGVDMHSGNIVIGPDVDSHGLTDDPADIHEALRETVVDSIARITERPIDHDTLRRRVRNSAGKVVRKRTNRRPVIFPVIIEV